MQRSVTELATRAAVEIIGRVRFAPYRSLGRAGGGCEAERPSSPVVLALSQKLEGGLRRPHGYGVEMLKMQDDPGRGLRISGVGVTL